MRRILLSVVFLSSLLGATSSLAENIMRPGLWEVTTTSDLLRLVPHIPPEQMQNLTNLARQYGFDMPQIQNGAAKSKACITQQMADQNTPPAFYHDQSGCTAKNVSHIGNSYRLDFVCANSRLQGNGTAEGTFTNPERFSGRTEFDGVVQGNAVNEHADVSARWIGASCGTVKPLQ